MAGRFEATVVVDRPIEEVFGFLADGENDPKFSPRVLEITKTTDGPPGVGTVYASTVKDAGMKTSREFKLTEFEPPTRIRWAESLEEPRHGLRGRLRPRARGRGHPRDHPQRPGGTRSGQAHRRAGASLGPQGSGRLRTVDQGGRGGRPAGALAPQHRLEALDAAGEVALVGRRVAARPRVAPRSGSTPSCPARPCASERALWCARSSLPIPPCSKIRSL